MIFSSICLSSYTHQLAQAYTYICLCTQNFIKSQIFGKFWSQEILAKRCIGSDWRSLMTMKNISNPLNLLPANTYLTV